MDKRRGWTGLRVRPLSGGYRDAAPVMTAIGTAERTLIGIKLRPTVAVVRGPNAAGRQRRSTRGQSNRDQIPGKGEQQQQYGCAALHRFPGTQNPGWESA
jgi:hypothetical protein